jgi:hypothetical protein
VTTLYKEVMAITRTVVRHADTMLHDMPHPRGRRRARLRDQLRQTVGLVRRVLDQTRARVIKGDTHDPDKILSIFEPHTEVIRKREGRQAHRVRQGRQDPGGRGADHHPTCSPKTAPPEMRVGSARMPAGRPRDEAKAVH